MSDLQLREMLADEARRLEPAARPLWDELVTRRRQRDVRYRAACAIGAVAITAFAVVAGPGLFDSSPDSTAGGSAPRWAATLQQTIKEKVDYMLRFEEPSHKLSQEMFSFIVMDGIADSTKYEVWGRPGVPLTGPVTITAHKGDEVACLRAVASDGVLTWQKPTRGECMERVRSVVDLEFTVKGN